MSNTRRTFYCQTNSFSRTTPWLWAFLFFYQCFFPFSAYGQEQATSYRVGEHGNFTRFVIDLSQAVEYKHFTLENPNRLVIDLSNIAATKSFKVKSPERNHLIDKVRYGVRYDTDLRIVLDVNQPITVKNVISIPPRDGNGFRLVFDIAPTSGTTPKEPVEEAVIVPPQPKQETVTAQPVYVPKPTPAPSEEHTAAPASTSASMPIPATKPVQNSSPVKAADEPSFIVKPQEKPQHSEEKQPEISVSSITNFAPTPTKRPTASPATKAPYKPLIVIDPGHGGQDPGATSTSGDHEKFLTLAYAISLGKAIESNGKYRVMLTRYDDTFIRLDERVAIARRAKADLFISLHADSHPNPRTHGLSIYTLSETASDREAAALAAKENKADILTGVNLEKQSDEIASILIDFAHRETNNSSARFAEDLVSQLKTEIRLLNHTHRFAGFRVLTAPDIPSILIELGYLSNANEEKLLKTNAYKNKLVNAVIRAIDMHFKEQKFDTAAYEGRTP